MFKSGQRGTGWANLSGVSPPSPTTLAVGLLRAVWLALPLAVGPALAAALDERLDTLRTVATVMAWGGWVVVLIATLVARASSLTVIRVGAPGALALAMWAAGPGSGSVDLLRGTVAVGVAGAAVALALAPLVGDAFVTGSAYGTERRFALRCPPMLAALAIVTWTVVAVGAVAGPLLLASEMWVAGAAALVVGAGVAAAGIRSLHQLARRWLVFVPSGLVVHDPVARPDAVMAPRPLIESLGPAPSGGDALDLSLGATGLSLVLATSEALPVTVRRGRRDMGTEAATHVSFTPNRPGAVLAEAQARRIPVAAP